MSAPFDQKCEPGPGLRLIIPNDNGPVRVSYGGVSGRCGNIFDFYYTAAFPDGNEGSFYVIKRLKEPKQTNEYCGISPRNGRKFSQVFSPIEVELVNVGDNRLLLYSDSYAHWGMCSACRDAFAQPTLLLLKSVPKSIWSSQRDVFVVPKQVLEPALDYQSDNVFFNYQAAMKAIGEETVIQSAP